MKGETVTKRKEKKYYKEKVREKEKNVEAQTTEDDRKDKFLPEERRTQEEQRKGIQNQSFGSGSGNCPDPSSKKINLRFGSISDIQGKPDPDGN